jgi:O-antigen/teichoic acid export membrane protein
MSTPSSSSRSRAASGLAAGSVLSGLLAYVFFAASTRGLGAADAAPVAVLWSYWGFAAAGLTFPVQHWITRTAAVAGEGAVRAAWATPLRLVTVVVVISGVGAWLLREPLFGGDARFAVLIALVGVGAAGMGVVRGLLAARRRYEAVGALLVAENLVRCVAALVLVALDVDDPGAYGVALLLGYAACAGWISAWRTEPGPGSALPVGEPRSTGSFLGGAAGAQVVAQAVLTGGPVLLAVLGGSPAEVTALFAALALYRAPYTVLLGQVAQATGALARLVDARSLDRLQRVDRAVLAATVVGVGVGAAVGAWLGPWLVTLVFGPDVRVEQGVSVALAVGSVLALVTLVQGVVLLAHGVPQWTLVAWLLALVPAASVVLAAPGRPTTTIATAFVVAEGAAWLLLLAATRRARRVLRRA